MNNFVKLMVGHIQNEEIVNGQYAGNIEVPTITTVPHLLAHTAMRVDKV